MQHSNLSPTQQLSPARSLNGKSAIVTGSTSGIGLGIARALAGAGADVMFNGFGVSPDFERQRHEIEASSGVKTAYSDDDMSQLTSG